MRRILFLAYHFPPVGGAGVQRNAKFARYLPEFGYEPVVVAGTSEASGRWTPLDSTLATELPPGTEVHRLPGPEPAEGAGWRGRAERWLQAPSKWSTWWVGNAVAQGLQLAGGIDLIYAAMAPYESAEAAARLARETGKPWVADLQDPWALDEMMVYPSGLHRRHEVARMRRLLGSASAIVMNTDEAAARVRRSFPELAHKTIVSIPNGFDLADFAAPVPERTDQTFRIVHTGYLHTELGHRHRETALARRLLGGSNGTVDILTRSHVYLLEAIERVTRADPSLRSIVELHLAGVLTSADREAATGDVVRMRGYVPHAESVALIRSADLLFLPMHDLPPGVRVSIVPGKTYEYLGSRRPILAAVPDGDARDLLESGGAFLCRPADSAGMAEILAAEVGRWRAGTPTRPAPSPVLGRYERRRLTSDLAVVFDGLLAGSRQAMRVAPALASASGARG